MAIKVGINGYGRIGRNTLRALYEAKRTGEIQIVEEKSERPQGGGTKRQVYRAMAWGPLQ